MKYADLNREQKDFYDEAMESLNSDSDLPPLSPELEDYDEAHDMPWVDNFKPRLAPDWTEIYQE